MPAKLPDDERIKRARARGKKRRDAKKAKALPKFTQKRTRGTTPIYEAAAHCARATNLALLGLTDAEIAMQFGISEVTMVAWKRQHPEFLKALNEGKVPADGMVAGSMYRRAIGYDYPAVKIFMPQGAEAPVYADYMEHHPADVNAGFRWLYNRQRHLWKDRQQVDNTLTIEHRIAAMTPEERAADARAFAGRLRQAIAEAKRARAEQRTIEGTATEVEE